jgi:formyl-CoA transferase
VPTYEEAVDDEQKKANDIIIPLDHPSEGKMRTVNSPFQVSSAEKIKPGAAPKLGEHTVEVLEQIGYSEEAIRKMFDDCVIEKPVS